MKRRHHYFTLICFAMVLLLGAILHANKVLKKEEGQVADAFITYRTAILEKRVSDLEGRMFKHEHPENRILVDHDEISRGCLHLTIRFSSRRGDSSDLRITFMDNRSVALVEERSLNSPIRVAFRLHRISHVWMIANVTETIEDIL